MSIPRGDISQQTAEYIIPFDRMGVAATLALLPTAGDATSLGRSSGTHGTNTPILVGTVTNGGATASASETARFLFWLPIEYVSGGAITIRAHARVSAARNTSAAVDFAAYEGDGEAGLGSDLVTTGATTINSTSWANQDFVVTSTGLEPGSLLDILMTATSNDTGGSGNGQAQVGKVSILVPVKG